MTENELLTKANQTNASTFFILTSIEDLINQIERIDNLKKRSYQITKTRNNLMVKLENLMGKLQFEKRNLTKIQNEIKAFNKTGDV